MHGSERKGHRVGRFAAVAAMIGTVVVTVAPGVANAAPPLFTKVFAPSTIGPGSTTTLTFTIDNSAEAVIADELAFSDTLPAGVTIATPAIASTSCSADVGGSGPDVSAPDGGGTITLANASVPAGAVCTVSVDVTASTGGTYVNTSGTLTSSEGASGTATDDLTVATDRPGFSKDFSPDP
ncbi:MAG: hypothetical protein HKN44_09140, partial [Ilumatobacter sp.]|nr:hypothetical protein [Ilumatobacter sp.]